MKIKQKSTIREIFRQENQTVSKIGGKVLVGIGAHGREICPQGLIDLPLAVSVEIEVAEFAVFIEESRQCSGVVFGCFLQHIFELEGLIDAFFAEFADIEVGATVGYGHIVGIHDIGIIAVLCPAGGCRRQGGVDILCLYVLPVDVVAGDMKMSVGFFHDESGAGRV